MTYKVWHGISPEDLLMIVVDFNARVGCGEKGGSWDGVHGCYGVGHMGKPCCPGVLRMV